MKTIALRLLRLVAALVVVASCGEDGQAERVGRENLNSLCHDGKDNDSDGKTDCDDPQCEAFCEVCLPDCGGPGLPVDENSEDLCTDGVDNDQDETTDCDDEGCDETEACSEPPPPSEDTEEACLDGVNNDDDEAIDCADTDCSVYFFCGPEDSEDACEDAWDNDGDGAFDCDDEDCLSFKFCETEEG